MIHWQDCLQFDFYCWWIAVYACNSLSLNNLLMMNVSKFEVQWSASLYNWRKAPRNNNFVQCAINNVSSTFALNLTKQMPFYFLLLSRNQSLFLYLFLWKFRNVVLPISTLFVLGWNNKQLNVKERKLLSKQVEKTT